MQSTTFLNRKGVTLIEAIVAGSLSIFVILAAMTLYKMNADQIRGSFVRCMTRIQYQTLIDQIEKNVREAKVILSTNDPDFYDYDITTKATNEVYFLGATGTVLGGYKRNGTLFREFKGSLTPFKVGSDTVRVLDVGNAFTIAGDRKSVQLNLSVFGVDGSIIDTVDSKLEVFTCRN